MSSATLPPITPETILDDLMRTHRVTIAIFIRRRMMCVGCPVAGLHDIREACEEHGIPIDEFLDELAAAIRHEDWRE